MYHCGAISFNSFTDFNSRKNSTTRNSLILGSRNAVKFKEEFSTFDLICINDLKTLAALDGIVPLGYFSTQVRISMASGFDFEILTATVLMLRIDCRFDAKVPWLMSTCFFERVGNDILFRLELKCCSLIKTTLSNGDKLK